MRIIHTADLHLGQVMYQDYTRDDEHDHFFNQLEEWCRTYSPDALLVSGDIFDIQQPGAHVKKRFNDYFVALHNSFPSMAIVITAGNHDSPSRIQADNPVWQMGNITLVGMPPASDCTSRPDGWQEDYIVALPTGFIIALPFMASTQHDTTQAILDYVARRNNEQKPVVLMGHLAVTGTDFTGHNVEIGRVQTVDTDQIGQGFDYMALGHIHRPQTLGYNDEHQSHSTYPSGILRYSGSPLHVSCDEKYPHSVSLVEMEHHGGPVSVTRLRIDEKRHFYELPASGAFTSVEESLMAVRQFANDKRSGYFRLTLDASKPFPADFNQQIYQLIEPYQGEIRFNPKSIWTNLPDLNATDDKAIFEVAELQQMTDPMEFVRQTQNHYPELDMDDLAQAFKEVEAELRRMSSGDNPLAHED